MNRAGTVIVVSAVEHPGPDEWVWEQARAEAASSELTLGDYLGREDVLPPPRPADLCCHVFDTAPPDSPAGTVPT